MGFCRSKQNIDGVLYAVQYGRYCSLAVDPMEKKPLYHFHPGSRILSIGNNSCNLSCGFCQNWRISQEPTLTEEITPGQLVELARREHSIGVAFTYAEPLMWYEFLLDACSALKQAELKTVLVTNGSIQLDPLRELLPFIDAMNIDVKSMREAFYKRHCGGSLAHVLKSVAAAHEAGCHVEVTMLLIGGVNDSESEIDDLVTWLAGIDPNIPLHFSRYFPNYRFTEQATPIPVILRCRAFAMKRLSHVYAGNVADIEANSSYCHACGRCIISRDGYRLTGVYIHDGACDHCGASNAFIGT